MPTGMLCYAGTAEVPIGTIIGLALGVGSVPGIFTYLGGSILLSSAVSIDMILPLDAAASPYRRIF